MSVRTDKEGRDTMTSVPFTCAGASPAEKSAGVAQVMTCTICEGALAVMAGETPAETGARMEAHVCAIVVRERDGFPVDVVLLPDPAFYEMFEPLGCEHVGLFADGPVMIDGVEQTQFCQHCQHDIPRRLL